MSYVQFHDNLYFNSLHPFTISIFGGTVQIICQKYIHINVYLLSELSTENAIDFISKNFLLFLFKSINEVFKKSKGKEFTKS